MPIVIVHCSKLMFCVPPGISTILNRPCQLPVATLRVRGDKIWMQAEMFLPKTEMEVHTENLL